MTVKGYPIPLVPGPVSVPEAIRAAYGIDFGSSDMEGDFFDLYGDVEGKLQDLLDTKNDVVIQSGEGMLALWGALKSALAPRSRVLAVAAGVFGYGFAEMARSLGHDVAIVGFEYDEIPDVERVVERIEAYGPDLVTAVHCETPSGTLAHLDGIGQAAREAGALFCVDFVSSGGGVPLSVDGEAIDLGLLGSQKVLSLPPDLAVTTVSDRAWEAIERVGYVGYDALAPWKEVPACRLLPYTHNWQALEALRLSLEALAAEGKEAVFERHRSVAARCREGLRALGVDLHPREEAFCSPTVTAARVPQGWSWSDLDGALREEGLVCGGSYGPLEGKVFRLGHMGSQARTELVDKALEVLGKRLRRL